jgi:uncharacterized protein YndB with AHSA1/START domain
MTKQFIIDQVEINAPAEKVWEVLTKTEYYKQWDELPEDFTAESLEPGSVIEWEGYSIMTVTKFEINAELKFSLSLPKEALKPGEYDVSYRYTLTNSGNKTILSFEIGDFSPLSDPQKYYDATIEFVETAKMKIKNLAEIN